MNAAIDEMNNTVNFGDKNDQARIRRESGLNSPVLSAVANQLGGENHPYGFSRKDAEFIILNGSSASAIAGEAIKLGIRCYDENHRQIIKEELAARVFAVHTNTMSKSDWFEPACFGENAIQYWKPKIFTFFKGIFILLTMFIMNYGRAYYAREFNCHWVSLLLKVSPKS
jgi:hypothetical protein